MLLWTFFFLNIVASAIEKKVFFLFFHIFFTINVLHTGFSSGLSVRVSVLSLLWFPPSLLSLILAAKTYVRYVCTWILLHLLAIWRDFLYAVKTAFHVGFEHGQLRFLVSSSRWMYIITLLFLLKYNQFSTIV